MKGNKLSGAFYTPKIVADFMVRHIQAELTNVDLIKILEPSAGDGSFIEAISDNDFFKQKQKSITVVEKSAIELDKLQCRLIESKAEQFTLINADLLDIHDAFELESYHLIIGNPPYINKKLLKPKQIILGQEIHNQILSSRFSLKNLWTPIFLKSCTLVKSTGIISFVLPAEILQVQYTEEIRHYIYSNFQRVEIINFKQLIFPNAGQDTVLLFCYKSSNSPGVFITTIDSAASLDNTITFTKHPPHIKLTSKEVHHELSNDDLVLLDKIRLKVGVISDYCVTKPGIVTAANDFFIINRSTKQRLHLSKNLLPIIQKGAFVNGKLDFDQDDFSRIIEQTKPAYLINLNSVNERHFGLLLRNYLDVGVEQQLNQRYKCKQRKRWFDIPNISTPWEGFFFKRCHTYPKLIRNTAGLYVTDTAYMVKTKEISNIESLIYSFYNSFTLIFSELNGRFYGGGVLELTPSEFKSLPIPHLNIDKQTFETFAKEFEEKEDIERFLEKHDANFLSVTLSLNCDEINHLQVIRKKLQNRRIKRI